jgi:hypothetical protein
MILDKWPSRQYAGRICSAIHPKGTNAMTRLVVPCATLAIAMVADLCGAGEQIRNYAAWTDTAGNPISCHDGGITRVGDTFYWYGTSYKGNPKGLDGRKSAHLQQGFNCYSSKNLVDWKYEGGR